MSLLLQLAVLALVTFQTTFALPPGNSGGARRPDLTTFAADTSASNDLLCADRKPDNPVMRKQNCRAALNKFIREFGKQSDYIFTHDFKHHQDPDYFIVPQFNANEECVVVLDLPEFQKGMLPIGHVPTIIRDATALIEDCVEKPGTQANGGRVFVPAEDYSGEFKGELIGVYIAPNLAQLREIQGLAPKNRTAEACTR